MNTNKPASRRQWMAGLLRGGLLAVFGATSFHLLRREDSTEGSDCRDPQGQIGCRACFELNRCKLPRALSVKQFLNKDTKNEKPTS